MLVVEDYASLRQSIDFVLRDEYDVVSVGTAEEALQVAPALRPEVVLLDLQLPGISGEELLFRLRLMKMPCRVIAISANHDPSAAASLLRDGASDYLCKPFGVRELRAKIREACAEKPSADRA